MNASLVGRQHARRNGGARERAEGPGPPSWTTSQLAAATQADKHAEQEGDERERVTAQRRTFMSEGGGEAASGVGKPQHTTSSPGAAASTAAAKQRSAQQSRCFTIGGAARGASKSWSHHRTAADYGKVAAAADTHLKHPSLEISGNRYYFCLCNYILQSRLRGKA